jgi:hypothetical protein
MHFCSSEFEEKLPELVEKIKGKDTVVFHCAKSQVSLCISATQISSIYKYVLYLLYVIALVWLAVILYV